MNQIELNAQAYRLLYELENRLRDFISVELSAIAGKKWQKQRVPGKTKQKWDELKIIEEQNPWIESSELDLIYFADFSNLKQIIEEKNNWSEVFKPYFGGNKAIVQTKLDEITPLRNKIAHNRPITHAEYDKLKGLLREISRAIGQAQTSLDSAAFKRVDNNEVLAEIVEELGELKKELGINLGHLQNKEQIQLVQIEEIMISWWLDSELVEINHASILTILRHLREYRDMPRFPGCAPSLKEFLDSNNLLAEIEDLLSRIDVERKRLQVKIV